MKYEYAVDNLLEHLINMSVLEPKRVYVYRSLTTTKIIPLRDSVDSYQYKIAFLRTIFHSASKIISGDSYRTKKFLMIMII